VRINHGRDFVSFVSSPRFFVSPPLRGLGEARLPLITLSEFQDPPLHGRTKHRMKIPSFVMASKAAEPLASFRCQLPQG